ncbi:MAG: penicillin-binding transpeptidase domain-containing protein [Pyrinomonadaceae bacterium]|nr:penicillin-binding transpeptidase domain-containing protein [Pyrinomonadaceae bacterium]MCX7639108.1 penicillin-binding transpeptidase domain-containing protein [Pyrinomonadaceae bacterium]MDW8303671.1 penicillin-binding transpeptidase domain-containing protein [Acidobacteriota bacterium]
MSLLFRMFLAIILVFFFFAAYTPSQSRKPAIMTKTGQKKETHKQKITTIRTRQRAEEELKKRLSEERKRQEAIRLAIEKQVAFERSLIEETLINIQSDQTEGEDLEIRSVAVSALGRKAGTIVVMETQSGRILTIVNQNWAVRRGFKPCSTIKLITAIAGLNEGLIQKSGEISFQPYRLDLTDALAYSNNAYFQRVGSVLGNEKFLFYAHLLGLGEKTGINLEGEYPGQLPFANQNPRIYSHGDSVEATPIQLAVMISAIANNGKIIVPQIPKVASQKVSFQGFLRRQIPLSAENLQSVLPGMIAAVNYGTARSSGVSYLNVAGKTGSCIGQGSWLGIFASVAPVVNPQFTVVVLTRGHNERGKTAAIIAGKIYKALEKRLFQKPNYYIAKEIPTPKPKVDEKTSILLDGGENEDIEDILPQTKQKPKLTKKQDVSVLFEDEQSKQSIQNKQKGAEKSQQNNIFRPIIIEPKTRNEKLTETRPRVVKTVTSSRIM